jgi:hypothetical protein
MIIDIKPKFNISSDNPTSEVDTLKPSMGIKTKLSSIISYLLWTYNESTLTYNQEGYTYGGMITSIHDIITPNSTVKNLIPKLRIK